MSTRTTAWRKIHSARRTGRLVVLGWAPNGLPVEHEELARWNGSEWAEALGSGYCTEATHWRLPTRDEIERAR